ncbi:MAG: hypothetical protein VYA59_05530 [Pseudomonadota bacterium]|jgi:hypothetical protein|nr:hypothetical protein [Pseudomonadota bacterium]
MYRDNTLIPTEAIRLAALGSLVESDKQYASLAGEIRYFVARITGPSLDLLGSSLELLHYEGLVAPVGGGDVEDGTVLRITPAGRDAFQTLITSNVRAPVNEVSKLVIALKLRFMYLLSDEDRRDQTEMLSEMCQTELARLNELRAGYRQEPLVQWLDLEIAQLRQRLDWFETLEA